MKIFADIYIFIYDFQSSSKASLEWDAQTQARALELLPFLFTYWSLNDTAQSESYLKTPHPGQVVTILRMLGFGYDDAEPQKKGFWNRLTSVFTWSRPPAITEGLRNNLVQVGTGEGKSLVTAISATLLTLLFDVDVKCACYSEYLSQRDYRAFAPMFEALGVHDRISYGTFNRLSEEIINENGDARELLVNLIKGKKEFKTKRAKEATIKRAKLLLVDEVDVFFTKDFYGNSYTPLARLKDPLIANLMKYIWKMRKTFQIAKDKNTKDRLKQIEASQEFKACIGKYKEWEFLFKESLKDMLADLDGFREDYTVLDDKIGYKEQGM
jgi:hypothetical protein